MVSRLRSLDSSLDFTLYSRFDWMRDEPNDWHSQDCLTFLKDQDIFGFGVWHWNDWDCDSTAGYICEKAAA